MQIVPPHDGDARCVARWGQLIPEQLLLCDGQGLRLARQHQGVAILQRRILAQIDDLAGAAAQAHHLNLKCVQRQMAQRFANRRRAQRQRDGTEPLQLAFIDRVVVGAVEVAA